MTGLANKITERIRAHGPVSFADYMAAALYDETCGFFMQPGRGPGSGGASDFVTSPEISPMFGALLVRHAGELWEAMGRPVRFEVVEAGGGRGSLAEAFLDAAASEPWYEALQYRLIDPIHHAGPSQAKELPARIQLESGGLEGPVNGLILANELLDNIPERLWHFTGDEWRELLVGLNGDDLCMVDGEPAGAEVVDSEGLSLDGGAPGAGEIRVGAAGAIQWVREAASALIAGELILIDYGNAPKGSSFGGIRTFAGHSRGEDPLESPGERDITLPVNWNAITQAARSAGLQVDRLITQAEWLDGLGLSAEIDKIRASEHLAANSGKSMDALGFRDKRMRAISLMDPAGLGGFTILRARRAC